MHTVAEHFERSEPQVQAVYDKIVKTARACGPVGEDPKKTSVHQSEAAWITQAYGLAE